MQSFAVENEYTPNLESLGVYVRDNRHALGLTQTALAERLGWVQERISLIERGKYGLPSLTGLARLANGLESPLYGLITALGYADGLNDGLLPHSPPDTQRLAHIAHDLGNHLTTAQGRLALIRKRAQNQGNTENARDATKAEQALWKVSQCVAQVVGPARLDRNVDSAPLDQWVLVEGRHAGTAGRRTVNLSSVQFTDNAPGDKQTPTDGAPRRHNWRRARGINSPD